MEGCFKKEDLKICNWQYTIRHTSVNDFVCGDKVFLKSNPEHSMIVHSINEKTITTYWYTKSNELSLCEFIPETILQFKYAGLMTYKEKYNMSFN